MANSDGVQILERADKLRHEADTVMEKVRLFEILEPHASVFLTGSYLLDVMAYPDIDIYITKVDLEQMFCIGAELARSELVSQVVFEKTDDTEHMPEGLYLKPRINFGNWGRPWKIDIWSLDKKIILDKMADMLHFQEKMTPFYRELIVRYKFGVMTAEKRTPMYSGYYIYKAILDEGLTDFASVTRYLVKSGVGVEFGG